MRRLGKGRLLPFLLLHSPVSFLVYPSPLIPLFPTGISPHSANLKVCPLIYLPVSDKVDG